MGFILPSLCLLAGAIWCLDTAVLGAENTATTDATWARPAVEQAAPDVWRVRFGTPERFTPGSIRETLSNTLYRPIPCN